MKDIAPIWDIYVDGEYHCFFYFEEDAQDFCDEHPDWDIEIREAEKDVS